MSRRRRRRILVYVLLSPVAAFLALPVLWMLLLSLRPDAVVVGGIASVLSTEFTLDNYARLFGQLNVLRYLLNSLIASVVPALVSVLVAVLAGYGLVRFEFRGRSIFYALPLFAQIVPTIQLLIPFYVFMLALGLLDTYLAVILAHLSLVLPLSVWMLAGYLRGVPREIEEAAMVDGCSRLGAVFRVVVPTASPGIMATGVVAFLETWGEFLLGYVLTSSEGMRLLSVGVYAFIPGAQSPTTWGLLFAMAAVFMAPSLIVFMLLQSSFRQGLPLGAVAGR